MRLKETARGSKFLRLANRAQGGDALDGIHQIVAGGSQGRIDFVVRKTMSLPQNVASAVQQEIPDLSLYFAGDPQIGRMGRQSARRRRDDFSQGERQLAIEDDFDHAKRGAPERERIA